MFFLWICLFIPNVLHSFQPIVFKPYPKCYGSGAVYLGGIQERPYKVYTYLVGGGGGWLILRWHYIYIYIISYIFRLMWNTYIIYIYIYMCVCVFPNRLENVRNQTQATAASWRHFCYAVGWCGWVSVRCQTHQSQNWFHLKPQDTVVVSHV